MNSEMRHYLNIVEDKNSIIHEGILDSIKKWVSGLGGPVKQRGQELINDLAAQLKSKYGAAVPKQTQQANRDWMWGKLTYKNLYDFLKKNQFEDADIDTALRNSIVSNNLKQLFRTLPADVEKPTLPLKGATIRNNTNFISAAVDSQSKQYLSKAIALAVIDGLSYIDQDKKSQEKPTAPSTQPPDTTAEPTASKPSAGTAPATSPATAEDPVKIKAAVDKLKTYLASKGAAA